MNTDQASKNIFTQTKSISKKLLCFKEDKKIKHQFFLQYKNEWEITIIIAINKKEFHVS